MFVFSSFMILGHIISYIKIIASTLSFLQTVRIIQKCRSLLMSSLLLEKAMFFFFLEKASIKLKITIQAYFSTFLPPIFFLLF